MTDTPQEQRDHWAAEYMAAQQQIAELRSWLILALYSNLDADALDKIRDLLERTRK